MPNLKIMGLFVSGLLALIFSVSTLAEPQVDVCDSQKHTSEFTYNPDREMKVADEKTKWSFSDTLLLGLRVTDWGQTIDIATQKNFNGNFVFGELNPLLGVHPSPGAVSIYFGSLIAMDEFIKYLAKTNEEWATFQKYWKVVQISAELACVIKNLRLGVRFKLPF